MHSDEVMCTAVKIFMSLRCRITSNNCGYLIKASVDPGFG